VIESDDKITIESGENIQVNQTKKKNSYNDFVLQSYNSSPWRSKVTIQSKSREIFMESGSEAAIKINYGIVLHDILSRINSPAETEKVLEGMFYEGVISASEKQELRIKLEGMFLNKTILSWFSSGWKSMNEWEILLPGNKISRPDKVLINEKQAIVIDFKTGSEDGKHIEQVSSYMKLLNMMGYSQVEGYLLYLNNVSIKKV
jgi:hypothetical protein